MNAQMLDQTTAPTPPQDSVAARCLDLANRLERHELGELGMGAVAFLIRTAVHDSVPAATRCASDRKAAN